MNIKTRITACDVTVIIPTFNGLTRGFIYKAIQSVLKQTLPPKRFIIVDDGSTDDTAKILKESFPELEIISKPNAGLPGTRNYALDIIASEFVCFLDDDDEWKEDKLERQFCYLQEHPDIDFLFCGVDFIDHKGSYIKSQKPTKWGLTFPEILLGNNILPPSTAMFRVAIAKKIGGFNASLSLGEDYDFFIRFARAGKIVSTSECLVRYRHHPQQMSGNVEKVDLKTFDLINVYTVDHPKRAQIIAFYCYGAVLRALSKGNINLAKLMFGKAGCKFYPKIFLYRIIGLLLTKAVKLKEIWRQFEYQNVLK